MDFFLKTEWILNVFGAAGIVMVVTLINRKGTQDLIIQKRFKSIRSTRLAVTPSEENGVIDQSVESLEACSDDPEALQVRNEIFCLAAFVFPQEIIAPLERHQLLHTRVTGNDTTNSDADTEKITETSGDLPPSYSLLDIEPPDYDDISIL